MGAFRPPCDVPHLGRERRKTTICRRLPDHERGFKSRILQSSAIVAPYLAAYDVVSRRMP